MIKSLAKVITEGSGFLPFTEIKNLAAYMVGNHGGCPLWNLHLQKCCLISFARRRYLHRRYVTVTSPAGSVTVKTWMMETVLSQL